MGPALTSLMAGNRSLHPRAVHANSIHIAGTLIWRVEKFGLRSVGGREFNGFRNKGIFTRWRA
jgi:hypothetical protein